MLLKFPGTENVGSSVGSVVGTFSDVDSGTETVGSTVIDSVGSGTGATDEGASCG